MTFGYSRDDAEGGFLLKYVEGVILPGESNPVPRRSTLDDVIAAEMQMAVDKGRSTRPKLKVGICGEHGGDPASIHNARRSGSTTCPARRSGSRWPGSPRPRRCSRGARRQVAGRRLRGPIPAGLPGFPAPFGCSPAASEPLVITARDNCQHFAGPGGQLGPNRAAMAPNITGGDQRAHNSVRRRVHVGIYHER